MAIEETVEAMANYFIEVQELLDKGAEQPSVHHMLANYAVVSNRVGHLIGKFNKLTTELSEELDVSESDKVVGFTDRGENIDNEVKK
jgi:hypothetical protein